MAKMRKRKIGECFICGKELQGKDATTQSGDFLPAALAIPAPGKDNGEVMACTDHPGVLLAYIDSGAEKMRTRVQKAAGAAVAQLEE